MGKNHGLPVLQDPGAPEFWSSVAKRKHKSSLSLVPCLQADLLSPRNPTGLESFWPLLENGLGISHSFWTLRIRRSCILEHHALPTSWARVTFPLSG